MSQLPLDGITVADLTHALSGSFCTQQLHLLGADVVKVEPPVGDDFRERPSTFAAINAGKRSVVLDLKSESGRDALLRLVQRSDVLVENFRPGVTRGLRIDWPSLASVNPRLVYCSISGYGQSGPLRDYPAIEWAVQAMSGMSASYVDDDVDGAYLGVGVLDPFSGYVAFSAILAALLQRQQTDTGQYIDVSMLDAAMLLMAPRVTALSRGENGSAEGRARRPTMVRYRASDRRLFVAALHRKWFERLVQIIGAPQLAEDPRFATQRSQAEHADALIEAIESRLATRPAAEWEAEFVRAGLPASVVRSLGELLAHPHLQARGTLETVEAADLAGRVEVVGAGFRYEHDQPAFRGGVPRLGEHTAEVLAELGVTSNSASLPKSRSV
jgi:crotonobetainyl-CoA:carnitine CoA-transferase CaiB-like acyl-CoA transferase